MNKMKKGFTLIELLVVMGILAVLLTITLVAINPSRQFSQANNTQRRSDVGAILNAIHAYAADHRGTLPTGITTTAKVITSTTGTGNVDLCTALVPTYIADLPIDPTNGAESPVNSICTDASATYDTTYTVKKSASDNRVTVSAPNAELSETISLTR